MSDIGNSQARVTVVTVVYNEVKSIARTIESTLSQRYSNLEYVIVDGDSRDGTQDVVRRYGSRIDLFISEPDRGIYDAMNKAVARASGEYIIFMNCGDVFAGSEALAAVMQAASPGTEEAIFGAWVRIEQKGVQRTCLPSLTAGLFNHQAIVYSRSIHRWHGDYVTVRGFTTADYLFFATLIAANRTTVTTTDTSIAMIDVGGVSSGLQTLSQKHAIDFLCGHTSRSQLVAVVALHPAYSRLKRLWLSLTR
jgi:glycosyltransferase involved in cell wall biosynthesis